MDIEDKVNVILKHNIEMTEAMGKYVFEQQKALNTMQCFFNDYISVASELSGIPKSVIIDRIKECSHQQQVETNLFVVK